MNFNMDEMAICGYVPEHANIHNVAWLYIADLKPKMFNISNSSNVMEKTKLGKEDKECWK